MARAIDICGLVHFLRDVALQKGARNDHIEDAQAAQQDHRKGRAQQSQVAHHDIRGDEPAGKIHGDDEQDGDNAAPLEIPARKRKGDAHREKKGDGGAAHGVNRRVQIAAPNDVVAENPLVAFQHKALGPEEHLPVVHRVGIGKRSDDHKIQRIEHNQQNQAEHANVDCVEDPIGSRFANGV